jgi:hypothetical protein
MRVKLTLSILRNLLNGNDNNDDDPHHHDRDLDQKQIIKNKNRSNSLDSIDV